MKPILICPLCGLETRPRGENEYPVIAQLIPGCSLCGAVLLDKERYLKTGSWFEFCRQFHPGAFRTFLVAEAPV
jgi:hypothetical protein